MNRNSDIFDKNLEDISFEEINEYVSSHNIDSVMDRTNNEEYKVNQTKRNRQFKDEVFDFKVLEIYGKLSDRKSAPVFAKVDWNGYVRYDIRSWDNTMTKPRKGISFTRDEMESILASKIPGVYGKHTFCSYSGGKATAIIYENICVTSSFMQKGDIWRKEINFVDWGYGVKVDMRKWSGDYAKCGKGICIPVDEYKEFLRLAESIRM